MREDGVEGVPRSAVVVGAGIVGLSTAWFLQEHGVEVTVVDSKGIAAGSSWGNAGYLSPAFSIPLPEPGVLKYGLRSLLSRDAPLYVPFKVDPELWSFLLKFASQCTSTAWQRSMRSFVPMNSECLDAYDALAAGGVEAPTNPAAITAGFENKEQLADLRHEFDMIKDAGQDIQVTESTEVDIPQMSSRITSVLRVEGQRYVDPGGFVRALGAAVEKRGGLIKSGFSVDSVSRVQGKAVIRSTDGEDISADTVVLSTGAWLNQLARPFGVRRKVQGGRGYSITVPTDEPVPGPIYLPGVRVACLPYQGALRVAGTMEFRSPDAALDRQRIEAIVRSTRPLLKGVRWEERRDEWVGARPVTADGLPLIGATNTPGVFVAGGHGMWGLTLGPLTGRLLSEQMMSGKQPASLRPFDPLR